MHPSTVKHLLYWEWLSKGGMSQTNNSIETSLQFNNDLVSDFCEYRYVYHNEGVDDFNPKYGDWIGIRDAVKITHDVVEVRCRKSSFLPISTYNYVWSHVVPRSTSIKTGKAFADSDVERQPSLIVLGIDSMSLSNVIRQVGLLCHPYWQFF